MVVVVEVEVEGWSGGGGHEPKKAEQGVGKHEARICAWLQLISHFLPWKWAVERVEDNESRGMGPQEKADQDPSD